MFLRSLRAGMITETGGAGWETSTGNSSSEAERRARATATASGRTHGMEQTSGTSHGTIRSDRLGAPRDHGCRGELTSHVRGGAHHVRDRVDAKENPETGDGQASRRQ